MGMVVLAIVWVIWLEMNVRIFDERKKLMYDLLGEYLVSHIPLAVHHGVL